MRNSITVDVGPVLRRKIAAASRRLGVTQSQVVRLALGAGITALPESFIVVAAKIPRR